MNAVKHGCNPGATDMPWLLNGSSTDHKPAFHPSFLLPLPTPRGTCTRTSKLTFHRLDMFQIDSCMVPLKIPNENNQEEQKSIILLAY